MKKLKMGAIVAAVVVTLIVLFTTGCFPADEHTPVGTRKLIFIDQSLSVKGQQQAMWLNAGLAVVSRLGPGDSIELYAIHARTADAAPLYIGRLPVLPARPTSRQLARFALARAAVITDASAALRTALESADSSRTTDVFSLFNRCRRSDVRPETVFIFSDMLHSEANFDLEKKPISEAQFSQLIAAESRQYKWSPTTLAGTTFYVVLPNETHGTQPINARIVLEHFYDALISQLGGRLALFETHFEKEDI